MDYYSPEGSKNRISSKKIKQVGINVKCMHTKFGGHGLSAFRDLACLHNFQNFPSDHGLQSIRVKTQNQLKKFMQVGVDVTYMQTKFGGHSLSCFEDIASFQIWLTFPFEPWTIVHGGQKIESNRIG